MIRKKQNKRHFGKRVLRLGLPLICKSIKPGAIRADLQSTRTCDWVFSSKKIFSGSTILPLRTHRSSPEMIFPSRTRRQLVNCTSFSSGILGNTRAVDVTTEMRGLYYITWVLKFIFIDFQDWTLPESTLLSAIRLRFAICVN